MSALAFELPRRLEAHEPPEARGMARDDVRLLVASGHDGRVTHARFKDLPAFLAAGDLLVVNTSATLPAALPAERSDGWKLELRLSTPAPHRVQTAAASSSIGSTGRFRRPHGRSPYGLRSAPQAVPRADQWWIVELRAAERPFLAGREGDELSLPDGGRATVVAPYAGGRRLWLARLDLPDPLADYLNAHGRPIRYGYVPREWPLSAYQNAFAVDPGSAEMPSAGRPLTAELVARLVAGGVHVAPVTLHTGVSSPERGEAPYPERFRVPETTARLVNSVRGWGGRVIAVGTTVVRALESATGPDGAVAAAEGWTNLVVGPEHGVNAVDGLITGWHEPEATHLQMLRALADEELLDRCYREALEHGYLWHEFGDSHLILP
jgi:S-adenosylmethionine:tRNA ribosyltransferase-isomerase